MSSSVVSSSSTNASFQATPETLRDLVLDYLLHNSYISTAQTFAKETTVTSIDDEEGRVHHEMIDEVERGGARPDTDSDIYFHDSDEVMQESTEPSNEVLSHEMLRLVKLRREIRVHILSGRVDEATHLLNLHFPSVLREPDGLPISIAAPPRSASSTSVPRSSSLLTPNATESSRSQQPPNRLHFASQVSTNPVHVSLNLRMLDFIESVRTVPLPYPPSSSSSSSHSTGYHTSFPSSSPSSVASLDTTSEAHQTALLVKAQRLYSTVQSLANPRDVEVYRKELQAVGGLLAYKFPENSPVSLYMRQDRREAVADQVNSAILFHLGLPAVSRLELITRYTTAVWSLMHDMEMTYPPGHASNPTPVNKSEISSTSKGGITKLEKEKDHAESIQPFHLRDLLDR